MSILLMLLFATPAPADDRKCLEYLSADHQYTKLIEARTSHFPRSTESYVSPLEQWMLCLGWRQSELAYADLMTEQCYAKIPGWFKQAITDHENAYIEIYSDGELAGYDRSVVLKMARRQREHCPE